MFTKEQKRIVRIVSFMDKRGIPHNCACGNTHKIEISLYEERNGTLKPRELVRLQCAHFYDALADLHDISININAEGNVGFINRIVGKIYIWAWLKWLNH